MSVFFQYLGGFDKEILSFKSVVIACSSIIRDKFTTYSSDCVNNYNFDIIPNQSLSSEILY